MISKHSYSLVHVFAIISFVLGAGCATRQPEPTPTPVSPVLEFKQVQSPGPLEIPSLRAGEEMHVHNGYAFAFDPKNKVAIWVAYSLTPTKIKKKAVSREDKFLPDPKVKESPDPKDYDKSGYDRGHLAPAEDMRWSRASMEDSFYMTNMTPQLPKFNRGLWKKLETKVRTWAGKYDETYIVTGPVLTKRCFERIKKTICAPAEFYKVVLEKTGNKMKAIGFLMPQKYRDKEIGGYVVSVDEVEAITNLNFFPGLPEAMQETLESKSDLASWQ